MENVNHLVLPKDFAQVLEPLTIEQRGIIITNLMAMYDDEHLSFYPQSSKKGAGANIWLEWYGYSRYQVEVINKNDEFYESIKLLNLINLCIENGDDLNINCLQSKRKIKKLLLKIDYQTIYDTIINYYGQYTKIVFLNNLGGIIYNRTNGKQKRTK